MANRDTTALIEQLVIDMVENTQGLISADKLRSRLIDIVQSRGLFEVFQNTKKYQQNEHVSFTDNQIYKCITDTNAGETPVTHPAKWQIIGSISTITAAIVSYTNYGYSNVEEALDAHETTLAALIPSPPPGLTGMILTMVTYQALAAATGDLHECTDDTTPDGSIDDVYNASSGDLSSEIDSVVQDTVPLDENDNSGTYNTLEIVSEGDPYDGQLGQGIYKVLNAIVRATSALTFAQHTYRLIHSETGLSALLSFYVDNPGTPVVSNSIITLPANATKYISGVPSLQSGDNIGVEIDISGAVQTHYHPTRVAHITGDGTDSKDIAPPVTPPNEGAIMNLSDTLQILADTFVAALNITAIGYNSKGNAGASSIISTNAYVDDVSDESQRLTAGSGLYPASGYGVAFDPTQSIKTVYTGELQMKNGKYQAPSGNYTANLPTAGEDFDNGMGTDERFCIPLAAFSVNNASGFTITINDAENFSGEETTDLFVQVKVQGITGWLDANKAFSLTGSPVNDGDACMVLFDSTATSKRVSFGDTLRTGLVYVRVGLPMGDNKKFSGITISNIV